MNYGRDSEMYIYFKNLILVIYCCIINYSKTLQLETPVFIFQFLSISNLGVACLGACS